MSSVYLFLRKSSSLIKILDHYNIFHYLAIIFITFLAHGLLLVNDGIYWDDWVWFDLRHNTFHWNRVFAAATEMGSLPYEKYFGNLFSIFSNKVFASKFFVFVALISIGISLFLICKNSGYFNRLESLLIASIGIVYPANKTQVILSTAFYTIYLAIFLIACLISLWNQSTHNKKPFYVAVRISSLLLFILSFSLNSVLVLFYCFQIFMFFYVAKNSPINKDTFIRKVVGYAIQNIDYMLLPILYWFIKKLFFPPSHLYLGYNQIQMNAQVFFQSVSKFVENGILRQFELILALARTKIIPVIKNPSVFYIEVALLVVIVLIMMKKKPINRYNIFLLLGPLIFGLILLAGSILPYAITGHYPSLYSWDTRHAILLSLPMAIILVVSTRLFFRNPDDHLSRVGALVLMLPTAGFILMFFQSYLNWETQWIKNLSFMQQLSQKEEIKNISVFRIDDQFYTVHNDSPSLFYEWSGMFNYISGDQNAVGMDHSDPDTFLTEYGTRFFIERYNLRDFDPYGCEAQLTINKGPLIRYSPSLSVVSKYYFLKFFGNPYELTEFLSQVAEISIKPFYSPVATHCDTNYVP